MALREVALKRLAIALDVLGDSAYIMNMESVMKQQAISDAEYQRAVDRRKKNGKGKRTAQRVTRTKVGGETEAQFRATCAAGWWQGCDERQADPRC